MPASTNRRARGGRFSRLDTGGCFLRATRLPVRIPVTLVVVLVLSIKVLVEYTMLPSELAVEAAMRTAGVRLTMEGLVGSVEILVPFLVLFAQLFGKAPEARGRMHLVGCFWSFSRSWRSLSK